MGRLFEGVTFNFQTAKEAAKEGISGAVKILLNESAPLFGSMMSH